MPGILPMKVIKVGNSAQSRIAQACDRCRSKKIRCDGVRPTCSHCANVGFECRTSDKLSRRAFPRGYTESLEERVRALETQVCQLNDVLQEKDEKIAMLSLSPLYPDSPHHHHHHQLPHTNAHTASSTDHHRHHKTQTTFRIHPSPLLLGLENSDAYLMGPSSGRTFITTFKRKLHHAGNPCTDFNPEAFLHVQGCPPLTPNPPEPHLRIPPRLFTDRCVNVYFQEWAPLFPALHQPSFLPVYQEFVADAQKVKCNYKLAQLYLVFSLAGLSLPSSASNLPQLAACERQWTSALDAISAETTMSALQCLVLALLYCSLTADYRRLQHYKSIAVGVAYRLGLHQSQKRFSFSPLTLETRKRVFWTLYTIDCFSAASLGLPKLLREADIQAEYPCDIDDEYITEKGLQTSQSTTTRISSALALFRATRVLAKVLDQNYPSTAPYDLSLQQMNALESELDHWHTALPDHLILKFAHGKPSTHVTGNRSPLLALAYCFIRTLIYRPAIGPDLDSIPASALLSIAESSKRLIQISELLEERHLSFSFCLNQGDLLSMSALTLLFQVIDLKPDSRLALDNQRLVNSVLTTVDRLRSPGCIDLRRIASTLVTVDQSTQPPPPPPTSSSSSSSTKSRHNSRASQSSFAESIKRRKNASDKKLMQQQQQQQQQISHNRSTSFNMSTTPTTLSDSRLDMMSHRRGSHQNIKSEDATLPQDYLSMSQLAVGSSQVANPLSTTPPPTLNYLPLDAEHRSQSQLQSQSQSQSPELTQQQQQQHQQHQQKQPLDRQAQIHLANMMANTQFSDKIADMNNSDWEALLGSMEGGMDNMYNAIYGGATLLRQGTDGGGGLGTDGVGMVRQGSSDWAPNSWDLRSFNLGELNVSQSVLSLSDDSLSSVEGISPPATSRSRGVSLPMQTTCGDLAFGGDYH